VTSTMGVLNIGNVLDDSRLIVKLSHRLLIAKLVYLSNPHMSDAQCQFLVLYLSVVL
jgi:hypothetical protein